MVERYRMGEANGELRMRLSDLEGERAIFCALQLYVNEVERLAIWGGEEVTIYEMEPWHQSVVAEPTPHDLERELRTLWSIAEGGEAPSGESYALAEGVCEALFSTRRRPRASGGVPYPYVIPRSLWSHDEGRRPRRRDAVATPANPIPTLVPVVRWLKAAFGELVSQAEASRRLGLTEEGVRARIREEKLRVVRVGGNAMIPAADLPSS